MAALIVFLGTFTSGQSARNGTDSGRPQSFPTTSRVTVNSNGAQGNLFSLDPTISSDGRFVAFRSAASNLVPMDTNDTTDVFLHDRATRAMMRLSVSSTGEQGNANSYDAFVSPDGRHVAFASNASNLVPFDTNDVADAFVHDRLRRTTSRVSVSSGGEQSNADCFHPSISSNGLYVAFFSRASNLVFLDTNNAGDIFVYDRLHSTTTRVSVSSDKDQANFESRDPWVSRDGRYVVFESLATNLAPRDTNDVPDIFVHDRGSATTTRVSVSSSGAQANSASLLPFISADGRYVTFRSFASNLVPFDINNRADIFVHDRANGTTSLVSASSNGEQGDGNAFYSFISADGRYVVFDSIATNLVPFDTNETWDVFVRDRVRGITRRASVSTFGEEGLWDSTAPAISADGRFVAFVADSDNLVPGDTNNAKDILVRGPLH